MGAGMEGEEMKQFLIAIDQLINTLFFGMADESISARAYRNRNKKHWGIAYKIINRLFFWQEDHCRKSYESEMIRKQLPREYR